MLFSSLVVGLLVAANSGFVYNITDAFTTNENFVEGAGKSHSAGTNVVIIEHSGNYKFDVLGGTVDLTPYELLSNKVTEWSSTTDDTRYPSEKLVKDSLDELENKVESVSDLSPYHFEGTFVGDDILQNDFDNLIVGFEDLKDGPAFKETKLRGSYFVCSADSAFYFNTPYHWSAAEGTGKTSAITYSWAAPYDLNGLTEINMKAGDIISILDFSYNSVSNTISTLIKVEKSLDTKADKVIPASTGNIPKLNASGNLEDSGFKLEKSVPSNAVFTDTVPTDYVVKNPNITGATKPKITYDAKGLVTAGADLTAEDIPPLRPAQKTITTATTLALTDEGKVILADGALKVTIPLNSSVSFPIDTEIAIVRYGTGEVTIGTASGATLNGEASTTTFTLGDQYSSVALKKISTDAWLIIGNFI